jgi:hypothetical protein
MTLHHHSDPHHTTLLHSLKQSKDILSHSIAVNAGVLFQEFVHDGGNAPLAIQLREDVVRGAM